MPRDGPSDGKKAVGLTKTGDPEMEAGMWGHQGRRRWASIDQSRGCRYSVGQQGAGGWWDKIVKKKLKTVPRWTELQGT